MKCERDIIKYHLEAKHAMSLEEYMEQAAVQTTHIYTHDIPYMKGPFSTCLLVTFWTYVTYYRSLVATVPDFQKWYINSFPAAHSL
jgi:hypothetical protein